MPQTAPPQILLVDDHELCLVIGDRLLAPFGVQVVRASGGAAALDACARQDFDLILMDIQMPDLDGIETTRRLRQLANPNARPSSRSPWTPVLPIRVLPASLLDYKTFTVEPNPIQPVA